MYFQDFMNKAQGSELQYLADASVSSMFTGNLPAKAAEALAPAGNDIVRTEQYMDFLTNRRFRSTLLCHQGVALNRALTPAHLEEFYVRSFLSPAVATVDLENLGEGVAFVSPTGVTLTVNTPQAAAVMLVLWENNHRALSFDQVSQLATEKLGDKATGEDLKPVALDLTMRLFLAGTVQLYADQGSYVHTASEKPEALLFARHQARSLGWVTNGRHERANMDLVHRIMLQYMDGQHDQDAILEKMMGHLESGELVLRQEDKEIPVDENARAVMKQMIANATELMARNALLSA
jgi:methyltransferase-like protein